MSIFDRRRKNETGGGDGPPDGLGEERIAMPAGFGDLPRVEPHLPEANVCLAEFTAKKDRLGATHPDTLRAAYRYATALEKIPRRRAEAVEIFEWLAVAQAGHRAADLLVTIELTRLGELAKSTRPRRRGWW